MMRGFFLLILVLVFAGAHSQSPVSASVDQNAILIGEQFQLYLKAVVPKSGKLPWFAIDSIEHFEILTRSAIDSQQTDKGLFLQQTLTLTSWDSGSWKIPPLFMGKLATLPLSVNVGYSPMDPNQPYHEIKEILEVPKPLQSNWYWYLLGLAVLVALFMLFFPPTEKKKVEAPPRDPFETAMEELEKLEPSQEPRVLYTSMVQTFRTYIHQRRNILSLSKTTGDLAVQLASLNLPKDEYSELIQVLQLSDAVKYARYHPGQDESRRSLEIIKNAIQTIEKMPHAVRVDTTY